MRHPSSKILFLELVCVLLIASPVLAAPPKAQEQPSLQGAKGTKQEQPSLQGAKRDEAIHKEKIDPKKRSLSNWTQQKQLEALIRRSKNDIRIDGLIEKHLGTAFKRASVYDLYPLEPYTVELDKNDEEGRKEFVAYYDYARKELVTVSQSPLLRVLHHDYDLDANRDYAVIVSRPIEYDKKGFARKPKHKERIYLLVANDSQVLYFQPLSADYLEIINNGNYPTSLAISKRLYRIPAPAFRALALDGDSYTLYYDRSKSGWVKMYTDQRGDGG